MLCGRESTIPIDVGTLKGFQTSRDGLGQAKPGLAHTIDVTLGALMHPGWSWSAAVMVAVLAVHPEAVAVAVAEAAPDADSNDARRMFEEATAAFSLGRYAEAAEKYEAAFALRPDPVLLYDAAQSFRLAGNWTRALELYRSYARLYPDGPNAADARGRAAALEKLIAASPPAPPPPAPGQAAPPWQAPPATPPAVQQVTPPQAPQPSPAASLPAAPPPAAKRAAVPMVSREAASNGEKQSVTHKTWFWVAVGAAVVIVGTTLILVATRGEQFPDATFGTARGN